VQTPLAQRPADRCIEGVDEQKMVKKRFLDSFFAPKPLQETFWCSQEPSGHVFSTKSIAGNVFCVQSIAGNVFVFTGAFRTMFF
jgi:hypothetical protein